MLGNYSYSLEKFEVLLSRRGISRIRVSSSDRAPQYLLFIRNANSITDPYTVVADASTSTSAQQFFKENPDLYYASETHENFIKSRVFDPTDDVFYSYVFSDESGLHETQDIELTFLKEAAAESYEAYHVWENHVTAPETHLLKQLEDPEDEVHCVQDHQTCNRLYFQPKNTICLTGLEFSVRYKNNLCAIIKAPDDTEYMLICCRSEILVFALDAYFEYAKHTPRNQKIDPILTIETKPLATSVEDRSELTWPYFPHTINRIVACADCIQGRAVAVCCDNGRVLIWHVSTIVKEMKQSCMSRKPDLLQTAQRILPDFLLNLDSSVWGIDFFLALDARGSRSYILAASANTRRVTLFYYDKQRHFFHKITTHSLCHNIPEVSFIDYVVENPEKHCALLSCVTIAGELLTISFEFSVESLLCAEEVVFSTPSVVRRTCLGSEAWTCKPVHSKYFTEVQSFGEMTGNHSIDESRDAALILADSRIFRGAFDPVLASDLGVFSKLKFYETPVALFSGNTSTFDGKESSVAFYSSQEECRRTHLALKSAEKVKNIENGTFLAVSTDKRLGLFRADSLFCSAATKPLFDFTLPSEEYEYDRWCNRILISEIIPEILAFVAVTQLGLVTIMRLCEHRGVYGMRQEHVFPSDFHVNKCSGTFHSIIGMSVRNVSSLEHQARFTVYLVYSDGRMLSFLLQSRAYEWEIAKLT